MVFSPLRTLLLFFLHFLVIFTSKLAQDKEMNLEGEGMQASVSSVFQCCPL
jgi:hypothetical protein